MSSSRSPAERPAPTPGEDSSFIEAIRQARADIASGIDRGGLGHDPLRYHVAESQLVDVPAAVGAALTGRDAAAWVDLMRENDIGRVNRTCAAQNGRKACSFVMWVEPVSPPRATGLR